MDLAAVRSLVREVNFSVHGVPALVTIPDGPAVETSIIWLTPITEQVPGGTDLRRADPKRLMALRRDCIPTVPRGTRVEVTEHLQESPDLWTVDAVERVEPDHHRVIVVPSGD